MYISKKNSIDFYKIVIVIDDKPVDGLSLISEQYTLLNPVHAHPFLFYDIHYLNFIR